MTKEPEDTDLPAKPDWKPVPNPVGRLLRSCLIKDPLRRLRDIGDARTLLDNAPDAVSIPVPVRRGMPWWAAGVLATALLLTGAFLWRGKLHTTAGAGEADHGRNS